MLRDQTVLRCSLRLPPNYEGEEAIKNVTEILEKDPPYGAHVKVEKVGYGTGWSAHEFPQFVLENLDKHNMRIFGTKTLLYGCGGSIPFIKTLQDMLPKTLLFVSGVVLPDSSIHGPNECLDIEYLVKFSKSLSCFLYDYANSA